MLLKVRGKQIYLFDKYDDSTTKPEPMEVSNTDMIIALGIVAFAFFVCGIMMAAI